MVFTKLSLFWTTPLINLLSILNLQEVQTGSVCVSDSLAKPICVAGPDQGDEHAGPEPCRVGGQTKILQNINHNFSHDRRNAYVFEIISAA